MISRKRHCWWVFDQHKPNAIMFHYAEEKTSLQPIATKLGKLHRNNPQQIDKEHYRPDEKYGNLIVGWNVPLKGHKLLTVYSSDHQKHNPKLDFFYLFANSVTKLIPCSLTPHCSIRTKRSWIKSYRLAYTVRYRKISYFLVCIFVCCSSLFSCEGNSSSAVK